jgi:glutamate--cysteine ligase
MSLETQISLLPKVLERLSQHVPPCGFPIYSSMDLRDSGWKVSVVDVNLFPAGFNNLSPDDRQRGALVLRNFFETKLLSAPPWNITIVPEAHTNNKGYLENLAGIFTLLKDAGAEPKLLWPGPAIPKPWVIKTTSGFSLEYLPAEQALQGAQALLLNHDMSAGVPKVIENVSLPTFPSRNLGWYRRKKSDHHDIIDSLLADLKSNIPGFDPWYFRVRHKTITDFNVQSEEDIHKLAQEITGFLDELREEYRQRKINTEPVLFVKNDSGTYGLGVFSVRSSEQLMTELKNFQKKFRIGKESVQISKLILQEGVPTGFSNATSVAEPTIYTIHGTPIGGFYRIRNFENIEDGRLENLNQPGSYFEPLGCNVRIQNGRQFSHPSNRDPCAEIKTKGLYNFLIYLHSLAASREECLGMRDA